MKDHLADTLRKINWLGRSMGGQAQAVRFLARARWNKEILGKGRHRGMNFNFRRCDILAIQEVLFDEEYKFLTPLLEKTKAPLIVDAGAHIGLFAFWCLGVNSEADILSVEASPGTYEILDRNRKNSGKRWRAINRAAWRDGEDVGFSDALDSMSGRIKNGGKTHVPGLSLKALMKEIGGKTVDIMKIDIEGAEEVFVCTHPEALAAVENLVIELHDDLCNTVRVRDALKTAFTTIEEIGGRKSSRPLLFCRKGGNG